MINKGNVSYEWKIVQHTNINQHTIFRLKDKSDIINSVDAEKAFDMVQHSFITKLFDKLEKKELP